MSEFCLTHGRIHYPGEADDVLKLGDNLECVEEYWDVVEGETLDSQCEESDSISPVIRSGDLAYIDSLFAGLVPAKVTQISKYEATVLVTAGRPGFNRGDVLVFSVPNVSLLARDQVTRAGYMRHEGPVRFKNEEGQWL